MPSSPKVPCRTGKITSTSTAFCIEGAALSNGISPCDCGTGGTITDSPLASTAAPGVACGSPARRWRPLSCSRSPRRSFSACESVSHRPSLVMPIGTTSYLSLLMALRTAAAESNETSCSPLRPPKSTPILSLFIRNRVALSCQRSAGQIAPTPSTRAQRGPATHRLAPYVFRTLTDFRK